MKKQNTDEIITRKILQEELDKIDKRFIQVDKRFEEMDEKARGYRDDILNKLDEMMGELEQIREDDVFIKHDLKNHDRQIIKLEKAVFKHA